MSGYSPGDFEAAPVTKNYQRASGQNLFASDATEIVEDVLTVQEGEAWYVEYSITGRNRYPVTTTVRFETGAVSELDVNSFGHGRIGCSGSFVIESGDVNNENVNMTFWGEGDGSDTIVPLYAIQAIRIRSEVDTFSNQAPLSADIERFD